MSLPRTVAQFLARLRKPLPEAAEYADRTNDADPLLLAQADTSTVTDAPRGLQPTADLWERVEISNQPAVLPPLGAAPVVVAASTTTGVAVSTGLGWGWYAAGAAVAGAAAGNGGGSASVVLHSVWNLSDCWRE